MIPLNFYIVPFNFKFWSIIVNAEYLFENVNPFSTQVLEICMNLK